MLLLLLTWKTCRGISTRTRSRRGSVNIIISRLCQILRFSQKHRRTHNWCRLIRTAYNSRRITNRPCMIVEMAAYRSANLNQMLCWEGAAQICSLSKAKRWYRWLRCRSSATTAKRVSKLFKPLKKGYRRQRQRTAILQSVGLLYSKWASLSCTIAMTILHWVKLQYRTRFYPTRTLTKLSLNSSNPLMPPIENPSLQRATLD